MINGYRMVAKPRSATAINPRTRSSPVSSTSRFDCPRSVIGQVSAFASISGLSPPYLRRTRSVEELLAWLYLKGIPTGDFQEAVHWCA